MRENTSVISKEVARELVLGHANALYDKIRQRYSESWHHLSEDGECGFRLQSYKQIADLVRERDLPSTDVNLLIGKIIDFEWNFHGQKVMRGFLSENGLNELANSQDYGDIPDVFSEAMMLFPQSGDAVRTYFVDFVDYFHKNRRLGITTEPWLLRDLLLAEATDFSEEEKQIIAKTWLVSYFIHGESAITDRHFIPASLENEQYTAVRLILERFGIRHKEIKEVVQYVVEQLPLGYTLADIENLLKNSAKLMDVSEIDWSSFSMKDLAEIYDYSRRAVREWSWGNRPEKDGFKRRDFRENLVFHMARYWWDKRIAKSGAFRFSDYINDIKENNFFAIFDLYLKRSVIQLGQRMGFNSEEFAQFVKATKTSEEITSEVRMLIDEKNEKDRDARRQEFDELVSRREQRLQEAMAALEIPGVRAE